MRWVRMVKGERKQDRARRKTGRENKESKEERKSKEGERQKESNREVETILIDPLHDILVSVSVIIIGLDK